MVAKFQAALVAKDKAGLENLFMPEGGSWFEVLGDGAYCKLSAQHPQMPRFHSDGYQRFIGFVVGSKGRIEEKFSNVRIGPEVLQAAVPPLLLRPLLENAIRHGIAPRLEPGRVALAVARDGERLRLSLRNDGVPAAPDATNDETRPAAVGLRNVRERLARLYGEAQRFEFVLAEDGGCAIDIALPCRTLAVPVAEPA